MQNGLGLFLWLIAANLVSFFLCWNDKWRAEHGLWRIPESRLLMGAAVGGAPGLWLGMQMFRHKTRKPKFKYGVPAILAAQLLFAFLRLAGVV